MKGIILTLKTTILIGILFLGSITLNSIQIITSSELEGIEYTILEATIDGFYIEIDGFVYFIQKD